MANINRRVNRVQPWMLKTKNRKGVRMKYKLTNNKIENYGITLYQIEIVETFNGLEKGTKGGYIQSEKNLSQSGNARVYGDARVSGYARVSGNARVYGDARVSGYAQVYGNAQVYGDAWVSGDAQVYGNARVYGDARVSGYAQVYGNAQVYGYAQVLQQHKLTTGYITKSLKNLEYSLIAQVGIIPSDKIILFKRVNKISKGKYKSCHDSDFIYEDGKVAEVKDFDKSIESCAKGIHLSTPLYWGEGDTLIQCEVNFKDIITIQEGKVRCNKCKVIGEVKI